MLRVVNTIACFLVVLMCLESAIEQSSVLGLPYQIWYVGAIAWVFAAGINIVGRESPLDD